MIYVDQQDRFQEIIKNIWKESLYECSVCVGGGTTAAANDTPIAVAPET